MNLKDKNLTEKNNQSIITVAGVGGCGGNAVNYTYRQGIHLVDFVICNTDSQALEKSPVPVKIHLGKRELGAEGNPQAGRKEAEESIDEIRAVLENGSKIVLVVAGMGGGTGTGASPVIARVAKELGIITAAIVTIPFRFEGPRRIKQALEGINELKAHVDSLLVIDNEKLREIYGDLNLGEAFSKADNVLTIAVKSIAELMTIPTKEAVETAMNTALLNNSDIIAPALIVKI